MEKEHEQENSPKDEEIEEVEALIVTEIRVTEEKFAAFIGKNAGKYLPKFRKFNADGGHKFALTWNWSALFLLTFGWPTEECICGPHFAYCFTT